MPVSLPPKLCANLALIAKWRLSECFQTNSKFSKAFLAVLCGIVCYNLPWLCQDGEFLSRFISIWNLHYSYIIQTFYKRRKLISRCCVWGFVCRFAVWIFTGELFVILFALCELNLFSFQYSLLSVLSINFLFRRKTYFDIYCLM